MLSKNAKARFPAQVPCMTCAMACSAWVRGDLRVFHCSSSKHSSLKVLTHFAATKKMTFREKNWLIQQESRVHLPPSPVHTAATGSDPAQRPVRRTEMRCSASHAAAGCRQCPGEGSTVCPVPQAGGHHSKHSQAVTAWDPDQLPQRRGPFSLLVHLLSRGFFDRPCPCAGTQAVWGEKRPSLTNPW